MPYKGINFSQKFGLFDEQWHPKVVAEMNDYQFKLEKVQGDFIWHDHKDTDENVHRRLNRRFRRLVRGGSMRNYCLDFVHNFSGQLCG